MKQAKDYLVTILVTYVSWFFFWIFVVGTVLTCWLVVPCLVFSGGLFGSRIAPASHIRLAAWHLSAQSLSAGSPVLLLSMGILSINEPLLNHRSKPGLIICSRIFWGGVFGLFSQGKGGYLTTHLSSATGSSVP